MRFTLLYGLGFIHDIKVRMALVGRATCVMGMQRLREHLKCDVSGSEARRGVSASP